MAAPPLSLRLCLSHFVASKGHRELLLSCRHLERRGGHVTFEKKKEDYNVLFWLCAGYILIQFKHAR